MKTPTNKGQLFRKCVGTKHSVKIRSGTLQRSDVNDYRKDLIWEVGDCQSHGRGSVMGCAEIGDISGARVAIRLLTKIPMVWGWGNQAGM